MFVMNRYCFFFVHQQCKGSYNISKVYGHLSKALMDDLLYLLLHIYVYLPRYGTNKYLQHSSIYGTVHEN